MRRYVFVATLSLVISGCDTPLGGVFSRDQTGGVTANSVGTVNQTVAPKIKSPYLKALQEFYVDGAQLSMQWQFMSVTASDDDVKRLADKSAAWVNKTYSWIHANITPAAAERFLQTVPGGLNYSLQGQHRPETNATVTNYITRMPQWVANLDSLMRSDEMYPQ